jgi:GNAT superfamily N-acetyltransferase
MEMSSHEIREYRDSDAHDIAVSFNEQNDVWPGGFTSGKEVTADDIHRWHESDNAVAIYVSVEDNHARGYCSLLRSVTEEENCGYIGLLGLPPKHHGKGQGRDLLRISIAKAISEGMHRVDLHTWAGNLKAVPLYKKTGFMWVPETKVFMVNFIPLIVQSSFTAAFFKDIDWYEIHERKLDLVEDEEKWNGMKVYSYRFARDGRNLQVKINAKSREMIYFEDDDYRISLVQPDGKPLRGRTLNMALEIESMKNSGEDAAIDGFGLRDITCDFKSTSVLNGKTGIDIPFTIGHRTPKGGNYDSYPTCGVDIKIGNKSMRLAFGLEAKPAVKIGISPRYVIVGRNVKRTANIELKSNADKPISGRLVVPKIEAGKISCSDASFELSPDGTKSIEIELDIEKSCAPAFQVEYKMNGEKGKTAPGEIPMHASNPFEPSTVQFTEPDYFKPQAQILRDGLLLSSKSRGASSDLIDVAKEEKLISISSTAFGPPFEPTRMYYAHYDQVVNRDGSIVMSAAIDKDPRLRHEQKITTLGGGWICVENSILNTTGNEIETGMQSAFRLATDSGVFRFAQAGRIISGMWVHSAFPADNEIPVKREEFSEGWISLENENGVLGIAFGDDISKFERGWRGFGFTYDSRVIPPNGRIQTHPVYACAGAGDYRIIRDGWYKLVEKKFDTTPQIEIHNLRRLFCIPEIPVVLDETECDICFDNLRLAVADGEITLTPDDNIVLSKSTLEFRNVKRDNMFSGKVKIKSKDKSAGASLINLKLDSPAGAVENDILVLKTVPDADVTVAHDGDEYIISNSLAEFRIDPDWGGGIHSFKTLEKEWLKSPYPDKNALFSWHNPFRGGIRPFLKLEDDWMDQTCKESWKISEYSEKRGGIGFSGIETKSVIESRNELKGLELKTRYLLSEGHHILKITYEAVNITDISYRAKGGFEFFFNVHPENKTRQKFDYGMDYERRIGAFAAYNKSSGWVITENEDTHECALVLMLKTTSDSPDNAMLWVCDEGLKIGQFAESEIKLNLKPKESCMHEFYFVPCATPDEAMKLRKLIGLGK